MAANAPFLEKFAKRTTEAEAKAAPASKNGTSFTRVARETTDEN